ncbi:MAG: DUF488 domain-containing protein [Thermomicrobiales bacterium]|nr:DUF488 domain-containing protein [Thermomicrobiales bacterium]
MPPPFVPPARVPAPLTVFTIGHSTVPADEFLGLLRLHQVATVLDVRSSPYSRYVPHFNRESLQALLTTGALAYEWAGDTLGGRPDDPACYHGGAVVGGKLDHAAVRQRPWHQQGIQRLMALALHQRTVLLCSEEDPRRCHRHHLVAQSLLNAGVRVLHIRRSGDLEDAETLDLAGQDGSPQQLTLRGIAA